VAPSIARTPAGLAEGLAEAEVIAPVGYGRGLPVLLPRGVAIMRRLVEAFKSELAVDDASLWEPELFVDADRYDCEVAAFGGFDNVYRLQLAGRRVVARPDAALDGARRALASRSGDALAVYHGQRRLQGAMPPLYRDSAIWPLIQLSRVVRADGARERIATTLEGLVRLFTSLALSVRVVRNGPWKAYARERYDVVLAGAQVRPTILAMLYVMGSAYREQLQIDGFEAFDVGVSEKVVAASWLCAHDSVRWTLPSRLAPHAVVVGSDEADAIARLGPVSARIALVPRIGKAWWRRPWRRGTPVLVEVRAGRVRTLVGTAPWRALGVGDETLDDLVAASDTALLDRARALGPRGRDPRFSAFCDTCAQALALSAPVVPDVFGPCERCRQPGRERFVSERAQVY